MSEIKYIDLLRCVNISYVVMYLVVEVRYSSACIFFFQAEDGIRDLVRSRGLGDVYKRQLENSSRNKIQQACDADCVRVNGKAVKSSYKVKPLSLIHI